MTENNRLTIEKIIGGGRGLAHDQGRVWMVSGALPGEEILAESTRERAGIIEARCLKVLASPHPEREENPCPHSPTCGGCDWPHIRPREGSRLKIEAAAEAARTWPDLKARVLSAEIRPSPQAYRLRCRIHWNPVEAQLGFYAPQSRNISEISQCRIISDLLRRKLQPLKDALKKSCPKPADIEWLEDLEGVHAIAALRKAAGGQEIRPHWVPGENILGDSLDGFHILRKGGKLEAVWGANSVRMNLPIPLEVRIGAFFQGNRHLVPWLFERVAHLCGPEPLPTWDLHGGVGFLAAAALEASDRPITLTEPVRAAARSARLNLPSARVLVGTTAEEMLRREKKQAREALVLCDPPRTGLSSALRKALGRWRPRRVLMLSCDPATWARDTASLLEMGWELQHLELIDLFPSSHHVELLCTLERPTSSQRKAVKSPADGPSRTDPESTETAE